MRHAQAVSVADDDRARPLTERGARDARAAGEWLRSQSIRVDAVVISTATRTRQTWDGVREGLGAELTAGLDPDLRMELYSAGPETALDELRLCDDVHDTVLLLGHNPTVAFMATLLHDGQGDPMGQEQLLQGFPPATMAVFEFEGSWSRLSFGDCRLVDVHTGRA